MKFRPITLTKEDETIIEIDPLRVLDIKGNSEKITLKLHGGDPITLYKKDYYYSHWDYFINQLIRIFEFERPI